MNNFNWDSSFIVDFDTTTGYSEKATLSRRTLKDLDGFFHDQEAVDEILKTDDPVIYEYYPLGFPIREGDIAFGSTVLFPGKVGNEYYMTKGHYHNKLMTAEVYYALDGEGYMIMENPEGDTLEEYMKKGDAVYVPRGYSHRTINTGDTNFVLFFAYQADAGQDYGTIEEKGYRKMIVEQDGKPTIVDNPKWN